MKPYLIFPVILFSLCAAPYALDQITTDASGVGKTKEEALLDAKKNAARDVIKTLLSSQIEIDSFTAKENYFISKVIGNLKDWKLLSETKNSDSLFKTAIRVNFPKKSVIKELLSSQVLIQSMNKPRIMVLISEENCGYWGPENQTAEKVIHKYLKDPYKFDLINPDIAASLKSSKQRFGQLFGDLSAAVATGTQNGAEVLIIGTAVSKKSEINSHNSPVMVSVGADVLLKVINCTTGRFICSENSHSSVTDTSLITAGREAIEKAAIYSIKNVLDPIIKDWQGQLNIGISINMTINAVRSYRQKNVIIQTLSRIDNISMVREQIWDPESITLNLDIYYRGNPNDLYKKLNGYKLLSGGGSLLLTKVNGQSITLSVQVM
jgi:hypothetical protein